MGFLVPGVRFIHDKKRKGRQNKPCSNLVYTNENKIFNRRYPNELFLQHTDKLARIYRGFIRMSKSTRNVNGIVKFKNLEYFRRRLEEYIILVQELENFSHEKFRLPIPKSDAIDLLRKIITMQGMDLLERVNENMKNHKVPPLEARLSRNLELIEGGCILFNKFLSHGLTVEIKKKESITPVLSDQVQKSKKIQELNKRQFTNKRQDPKVNLFDELLYSQRKITELPDEILVKIISYSNNVNNISMVSKFFHNFIMSHLEFISFEVIANKYTHRYKLTKDTDGGDPYSNDEHHLLNSHNIKVHEAEYSEMETRALISSDFKRDVNGNFILTRYKDKNNLIVLSSGVFDTPFLTYQIYKSLKVDHVIPVSAWQDLQERYNTELSKLAKPTDRISKMAFQQFWNETAINMPYMNQFNPGSLEMIKNGTYVDKLRIILDLMVSKTRFTNDLEDILFFITSLIVQVESDQVDDAMDSCIVPFDILKQYSIYHLRQNRSETEGEDQRQEANEVGNDNNANRRSDDEYWNELTLKNPYFYAYLKNTANEELEYEFCRVFYRSGIENNVQFWTGLKNMGEMDLIEELIERNIAPSPFILTLLAG
ncbi:uncharacterized protein C5L36_0A00600 [Pichia kudriavzevii]|uniref:F-box domain-containing protein n=1 Tax=Pichia kudriavzevii TaxID=4909 RepID=A0A2U9QWS3_PICKU|nr:uncharacterized protein C5L36_0A00600 [Pichia kudriavzevii]AWU73448.1 hypothetical protein C5L36_0A00600 [Pichia kudriavzevii]